MSLNPRQIKFLRGLSHHLKPVVTVAGRGLNENVMAEIENALEHHELVKIKLRADRKTRAEFARRIALECNAQSVQSIGQVASFYRRNESKPVIELPA